MKKSHSKWLISSILLAAIGFTLWHSSDIEGDTKASRKNESVRKELEPKSVQKKHTKGRKPPPLLVIKDNLPPKPVSTIPSDAYRDSIEAEKERWGQWVREYNRKNPSKGYREEGDSVEKTDRPDLAAAQNYKMTVDPKLGYIPSERLFNAKFPVKDIEVNAAIAGVSWVERGPSNVGGRTRALAFDPNDPTRKKVWAGGVAGGLWYTNDITVSAPTWVHVDDLWDNIAITTIAFDPSNSQVIYVGTGEGWFNNGSVRGGGIWKSTNGGITWSRIASTEPGAYDSGSHFQYVNKIVVTSTGVVMAATRGYYINTGGIMRSTNGGTSWSRVLSIYDATGTKYDWASDIEIAANGDVYAGFGQNESAGRVYKSTNSGVNWTDLSTSVGVSGAGRIELACAPSNSSVVYVVARLANAAGSNDIAWVKRTTDGGANWSTMAIPRLADDGSTHFTRSQSWYDLILQVHPTDENLVLAGGIDLHRTLNGCSSWVAVSHWYGGFSKPYVHADQHAIVFRPGFPDQVLFGNDGGVYLSTNAGNTAATPTFSERNNGYNVTQFYSVSGRNAASSNNFLAGSQDNGTQIFATTQVNLTTSASGGDGGFCHIDQLNPNIQISSYTNNSFNRSLDGGKSFTNFVDDADGHFINPSTYDNQRKILYSAGDANVLRRFSGIDGSITSTNIESSSFGGGMISALKVSPTNDAIIIGFDNGRIYKITNPSTGAPSAARIDNGSRPITATGWISSIDIGANDNQILVTFSNYGVTSVWETTDGGTNWYSKEGNLPDMPIRWAIYNPNNRNQVMAATELGVWTTDDFGPGTNGVPVWGASNTNLAHTRCDMLYFRPADGMVAVATHGRGMYTTDAFVTSSVADFVASSTMSCSGSLTVNFTDNSAAPNNSWAWDVDNNGTTDYTTQNPTHTYSSPGAYTVKLTVNSGASTVTKKSFIVVSSGTPNNPSCTIGTDYNTANIYEIGVYRFSIGNLDKTTSHSDGPYIDYACTDAVVLNLGTTYAVRIRNGKTYDEAAHVYIDYNDDGSFDLTNEKVAVFSLGKDERTVNYTTPMSGVTLRKGLRMRVVSKYGAEPASACDRGDYSQIEDYTVYFSPEYTWTGAVSTAWNLAGNWSPSAIPGENDNIVIPDAVSNRDPVLPANTTVGNLDIASGAKLGLNGNTLTVTGSITGTGTITGSSTSSLTVNGISGTLYLDQTTPGTTNVLRNLSLAGSATTTLGNALNITAGSQAGRVTVEGTARLSANGNLRLKSDANGTAMIAQITSTAANPIEGLVTVERYIPAGRKWRFLGAPLKGSTNNSVFYNWQNNDVPNGSTGVEIWGPAGSSNPSANSPNNGLALGASASMLTYSSGWQPVTNTNNALLFDGTTNNAFALFLTGPYNNGSTAYIGSPGNLPAGVATTLSATGNLITGDHPKTLSASAAGQYFLVANPYASSIDPYSFATSGNRSNLNTILYMWDAKQGGDFNVGRYVSYDLSVAGGAYSNAGAGTGYPDGTMIQSGQAFFVQATGSGPASLLFKESSKSTTASNAMMGDNVPARPPTLRFQLWQDSINCDGAVAFFHEGASHGIDAMDGTKMPNSSDNLGLRRAGRSLVFEHKPELTGTDTLFLHLGQMRKKSFRLRVEGQGLKIPEGMTAKMVDLHTGRESAFDPTAVSNFDFTVGADSTSYGERFMVVFTGKPASLSSTNEPTGVATMRPYPNPVTGSTPVRINIEKEGAPWRMSLLDAKGREVWVRSNVGVNEPSVEIDMSRLSAGVYQLVMTDSKGRRKVSQVVRQ